MRLLVSLVCVLVILAFAHIASSVVVPFLLGTTLAIAFYPLTEWLDRRGLPPVIAALVTSVAVLAVVVGAGALIYLAASDLSASLPEYQRQFAASRESLAQWLVEQRLDSAARSVHRFDTNGPAGELLETSLLGAGVFVQTLFLVLVICGFIQVEAAIYRRKLIRVFGSQRPVRTTVAALHDVQRYLAVKVAMSLANGVLLGLWCWAWGVDSPLLWGVLAFVLNFIPVVGSILAAIPPLALSLVDGGIGMAVGVGSGYLVVNIVFDNMLEPRIMGRALGLSPLVILMAMLVWGFVLGPVGALLSVPLTMVVKILFEHDEELRGIAVMMGSGDEPKKAA